MNNKNITVFGSNCAVTGCGKIGKSIADRLSKFGACVTVGARGKRDLAWAESMGMKALHLNDFLSEPCMYDCIFNTVPCNIFNEDFINRMTGRTLYIELASAPYGIGKDLAEKLADRYVPAPSLPGKTAPETAGRIIAETIIDYL